MNEKLRQIADYYGLDHQLGKLEEEANELAEAASDYRTHKFPQMVEHLLEEIGDVENVIYQIKYLIEKKGLAPVNVVVDRYRENKIDRQLERMEKEKTHA